MRLFEGGVPHKKWTVLKREWTKLQPGASLYSRFPLMRFNEPPGYAENPDNLIFLLKIGYIDSLKFICYYLQYVLASKPFVHT